MSTLLLRLAAPMQSWGIDSKFDTRSTQREPSKSGVLGMVAAALGLRRDDTVTLRELASLRFGVRVDREGKLLHDFHMAHGIKKDKIMRKSFIELHSMYLNLKTTDTWCESYVTHRYYLCDAVFLCGLESEDRAKLEHYAEALTHPAFPLFLGRRSCPPTLPLVRGIRDCALETALQEEPSLVSSCESVRMVIDASAGEGSAAISRDVPVSFSPRRREFVYRKYREIILPGKKKTEHEPPAEVGAEHDPFAEVEAEYVSDTNGD